jgi:hypothetical protein
MILDYQTRLATALAFTDADVITTYSYDLGDVTPKRRIGAGTPLAMVFTITTAAAGDSASQTDANIFEIIESTAADLGTAATVIQSRTVAGALLTAGAMVVVNIPPGMGTKRYIGGRITMGTGDTLSANVDLIPLSHVQDFIAYNNGYEV